jgi:hypothetical protein
MSTIFRVTFSIAQKLATQEQGKKKERDEALSGWLVVVVSVATDLE